MPSGEYEYVPVGIFYLSNWSNSTGLTASLEATDALGLLNKTIYSSSPFWENEPVENVLRHIIEDAGDFSLTVSVDAAAETVTGYIPAKSHRDALADALLASQNVLRISRSGVFEVVKADYSTPLVELDNAVIIGSAKIDQLPFVSSVEVSEPSYVLSDVLTEVYSNTFNLVGEQTMLLDFGGKAVSSPAASVTGLGFIVGSPVYSATSTLITLNGSGELTLIVEGYEYVEATKIVTASNLVPAGEIPQTSVVQSNNLLVGKGELVANHMLTYFQKRIKQTFTYWCDPAIQAGDCIDVETMFGGYRDGVLERQEISLSPTLRAKLEVIG